MTRHTLNLIVDIITAVVGFAIVATGLLMYFVLPPGHRGGEGRGGASVWGMTRHDWGDWHFYLSLAAIALVLIHVILHWRWVCVVTMNLFARDKCRTSSRAARSAVGAATVVLSVGLLLGFLLIANAAKQSRVGAEEDGHRGRRWQQITPSSSNGESGRSLRE